ncbi:NAD(P)-dependent dehydrogenase (short-subunit alcohol dehydrogenase family) [Stella humosa]|uniref:NAD(P)-dependent dehydrogenase (Short-subunit alcohol dehydrogenase family) n=1 Tax=Stella humosa TaxID=94 RepID=A0A3N1MBT3_9PROT|nr:SDR family NAD(P)-dependent oxidoreductase [Stella humosa]ROQ00210.1 NAD(P)-dependent dehydrogenase (short-subunit alcohol dehydrogenase family) [Stella humosa]BBK30555.1 short-chain dehydrogenase/reductase [Stella humosa]
MEIRLDGRVALITGGSKGLGRAMGEMFATSGASVVLAARGAESLETARAAIAAKGGEVHVVAADVATADGCKAAYQAAVDRFGRVDILVNNAGKSNTAPFASIDDATWQDDIDLKLFAAIRLTRLAFPAMCERGWGRVINVLNTHAKAPGPRSAPTSVTRAAGLALTKVLANEGAPHNVLVNALLVGQIDSDQWTRQHAASGTNLTYAEFLAEKGKAIPMGRVGRAEEFASVACLLVSDAGGYVTGTAINVDGGRTPIT